MSSNKQIENKPEIARAVVEFIVKNAFTYFHRVSKIALGFREKKKKTLRVLVGNYEECVISRHRKRDVTRFFTKWIFDGNVLKSRAADRPREYFRSSRDFVRFHPVYIPRKIL